MNIEVAEPRLARDPGDGVEKAERPPETTMESVARSVSWQLLGVLFGQGTWYASLLTLAALLPPHDFGVMAVATAVVSFTLLILSSGTGGMRNVTSSIKSRSP